jgi:hypothetical protein
LNLSLLDSWILGLIRVIKEFEYEKFNCYLVLADNL